MAQSIPLPSAAKVQRFRRFLSAPTLLFLIIITQIPFVFALYYSFRNWNLNRPGNVEWIGWRNYARIIHSECPMLRQHANGCLHAAATTPTSPPATPCLRIRLQTSTTIFETHERVAATFVNVAVVAIAMKIAGRSRFKLGRFVVRID